VTAKVCSFVCLFVAWIRPSEKVRNKFCRREVGHGPRKKWLDFGGDPDAFVDFGSFSRYH